jgi:polyhydroxyalkanoate synthesis regulator phasin
MSFSEEVLKCGLTIEALQAWCPDDVVDVDEWMAEQNINNFVEGEGAASVQTFVQEWTEGNPCRVNVLSNVIVKDAEMEAAAAAAVVKTAVESQPGGSKLRRLLGSSQSTLTRLANGKQFPPSPPPQPPSLPPSPQAPMPEETEGPSSPVLSGKKRRLGGKRRRRDSHVSDEGQQQQQNPAWFDDFTSSQKTALLKVFNVRASTARELELAESEVDARKKHISELEKQLDAAREQLLDIENNCVIFRNRLKHLDSFK